MPKRYGKRSLTHKIKCLNRQAREHRMFGETEKADMCYKLKEEIVRKYGKPLSIHMVGTEEVVAYRVQDTIFHIPAYKVSKRVKEKLKVNKSFKYKIGMRY